MSKVTNYNEVMIEVKQQLIDQEWTITEYMPIDKATVIVTNIYMMSDLCFGFGQDVGNSVIVISSLRRISVIYDGRCGMFKHHEDLCVYESLSDDISVILMVLQAAFDRMND